MSVATLSRPSTRPRVQIRPYPIAEPAGLAPWRAAAAEFAETVRTDPSDAMAVMAAVRAQEPMESVLARLPLTRTQVLDVVAGVGARIGQANKSGPRAARCLSFNRGARSGLTPGAHLVDGELIVVVAEGWSRSRKEPRDVARSYAAIVLSDPAGDAEAVDRWLVTMSAQSQVTYQHLAHLYAVARGTFATLAGISTNPLVQDAYVRGFDSLVAAIRNAHAHMSVVLDPGSSPAAVLAAVRESFWLLGGFARSIGKAATAAAAGHPAGEPVMRREVSRLRSAVERNPRVFLPRSLADLSQAQFRAVCARQGMPVPADDDGAREGSGEAALLAALQLRRQKLLAAS